MSKQKSFVKNVVSRVNKSSRTISLPIVREVKIQDYLVKYGQIDINIATIIAKINYSYIDENKETQIYTLLSLENRDLLYEICFNLKSGYSSKTLIEKMTYASKNSNIFMDTKKLGWFLTQYGTNYDREISNYDLAYNLLIRTDDVGSGLHTCPNCRSSRTTQQEMRKGHEDINYKITCVDCGKLWFEG